MPETTEKCLPFWDLDGQPINLAAAAEDAREWLTTFRDAPLIAERLQKQGDALERLERAISAIERFVEKRGK